MKRKNEYRIYLSPPNQSGAEANKFAKVLKSNWLAPGGEFVDAFENEIARFTARKHCLALNSGTAALHLALRALGIGQGDYVICPAFTFVATANPIVYLGATPVFIDSEEATWNISPDLLESAILDLKKKNIRPKAIVYAHIYGMPAQVDDLQAISEKYEIPLIEDAAEALGASVKKQPAGSFGAISILSFNGNKVITTAGGGALLTDDAKIYSKASLLAAQARSEEQPYLHTEVGFNYQMSNLNAALGVGQLSKLGEWVKAKRKIFQHYLAMSSFLNDLQWSKEPEGFMSNRWLSAFLVSSQEKRDHLLHLLNGAGIESRRLWMPLPDMGIYQSAMFYENGVSRRLFEQGLCLPSGSGLTHVQQQEIIGIIRQVESI